MTFWIAFSADNWIYSYRWRLFKREILHQMANEFCVRSFTIY